MASDFDPNRLRLERFNAEWIYHATYTFWGLKGALAERWAHGPIFGAVSELGRGQINLTPEAGEPDAERLLAVAGIRASGLLGEGPRRAAQATTLWRAWLDDVQQGFKPLRSIRVTADLFGLYPIRDEWRVTERITERYYTAEALDELAGVAEYHVSPQIFEIDGRRRRTLQIGVVGPPHAGVFFNFEDKERDARWWLGFRLQYSVVDEDGLDDPLALLTEIVGSALGDWGRVGRTVFPRLV